MARTANSFKRPAPRFRPQPTVLVLCEDSKSGKKYIEDAAFHFRSNAKVEVAHCGVTHPSGIVAEAIRRKSKFDTIYCVVDRDEHKCFDRAILMAKDHKNIELIKSFPCFEFWLLLHFGFSRKPFSRSGSYSAGDNVNRELKQKNGMNTYDKKADINYFGLLLGEKFDTARQLAPRVMEDAVESGESNPSTELHLLINKLEELGTPIPAA
ncbi:hypothetical protein BWR15_29390 [Pseudomonas sp. T]|nr:hypothetical protein BWR15_29390 [Pseudomonas sp. T]